MPMMREAAFAVVVLSTTGCGPARLAELEEEVEDLAGENASLNARLQALEGTSTASTKARSRDDDDSSDDNAGSSTASSASVAALEARLATVERDYLVADDIADMAHVVSADMTLSVPSQYSTIGRAIDSLDDTIIAGGAHVAIVVAAGTYTLSAPLVLDHANGGNISIVGAGSGVVKLKFTGSTGVWARGGNALKLLNGVTITGDGSGSYTGVLVDANSSLVLGSDVVVEKFGGYGLEVATDGVLIAEYTTAQDNRGGGFIAYRGGMLRAYGSISRRNGLGYMAFDGAYIGAEGSGAYDNLGNGYDCSTGAFIDASSAVAVDNNGVGFVSWGGGAIFVRGTASTDNAVAYDPPASTETLTANIR